MVYFTVRLPEDEPTFTAAFVKCLPILYLIWFVWLQGILTGITSNSYNRKIFYGLILSSLGDIFLIWGENDHAFIGGAIMFGLAHIFYMSAFGWTTIGWKSFVLGSTLLSITLWIIVPSIPDVLLLPTTVYAVLCTVMFWRGLARVNLTGNNIPWRSLLAAIGVFLFGISDFSLAVNKFCLQYHIQRELIMITYYTSQLLLSLSVTNSRIILMRDARSANHSQASKRAAVEQAMPIAKGH